MLQPNRITKAMASTYIIMADEVECKSHDNLSRQDLIDHCKEYDKGVCREK
jgi:hypothetical protein